MKQSEIFERLCEFCRSHEEMRFNVVMDSVGTVTFYSSYLPSSYARYLCGLFKGCKFTFTPFELSGNLYVGMVFCASDNK